jgi:hypothetical protein
MMAGGPLSAQDNAVPTLEQLSKNFTVGGEPVPPEVFRDLGDGNLADSASIWVSVDLIAAVGSNFYADDIKKEGDWVTQTAPPEDGLVEATSYRYIGATANGLLVAIASYSAGGSGVFYTLHILDTASTKAFTSEGAVYERLLLTELRSVALGDRWNGDARIQGNTIEITTRGLAAEGELKVPQDQSIEAQRP